MGILHHLRKDSAVKSSSTYAATMDYEALT